jgi:hypothetical protein
VDSLRRHGLAFIAWRIGHSPVVLAPR